MIQNTISINQPSRGLRYKKKAFFLRLLYGITCCFLIMGFGCSTPKVRSTSGKSLSDNWVRDLLPILSLNLDDARQAILVVNSEATSSIARVYALERQHEGWQIMFPPTDAVIGRNGFAAIEEKREGDGKTPSGIYTLGTVFGYSQSVSTIMPYQQVTDSDIWVYDVNSVDYNKMVKKGNTNAVFFEEMKREDTLYEYGIVINYNVNPVIRGNGSAIFFHVWMGPTTPTSGCVAMPEATLLSIIKWLDPSKKPIAVIGTKETIQALAKANY